MARTDAPAAANGESGARFEDALAELEGIVRRLEHGELPLEESLAVFERGMILVKELGGRLEAIEQRVEVLLRTADGSLVTRSLDEDE
ncbi:MAG: exodeoxyribonuclease VII small subunit [bacterium]|nr:exodeoxyribonuclease VII small subunit [bacterium]